jgi:cytochrome c556
MLRLLEEEHAMPTYRVAFLAAGLLPLFVTADPPTRVGMPVDQLVAARQSGMVLASAALAWMEKAPERNPDIKKQAYMAGNLAKWAKTLPALFPAGSGPESTSMRMSAKPEVWTDRPGYEKAAQDFITAATRLTDVAKAGDLLGFKAQISVVQKSCDECHQQYKD